MPIALRKEWCKSTKLMRRGHTGSSKYLEVWKDSPVNPGCVTSTTEMARYRVTSAPSAPRELRQPLPAKIPVQSPKLMVVLVTFLLDHYL